MLIIKDLHASIDDKKILNGINLSIKPGELHAIMGRNGSGKSTLANIITGREDYDIDSGSILFNGKDLLDQSPEDRALDGVFMSFQYPVVIPGVNNTYFLKAALNSKLKHQGLKEINAVDFMSLIREKLKQVDMDEKYLSRAVNDGFSGGEKKRNEILQMLTLEPTLSILDETDSGLDIDALKIVAKGVNDFRNKERSFLAITHYQRLLDYMKPDFIHVLIDGEIVKSGNTEKLPTLIDQNCIFYSPVVFTPQEGKEITLKYLSAAALVFGDESFTYTKEIINENNACLEFELELNNIKINGVDLISWNKENKIIEFRVLIRPLKGVQLIHELMGGTLEKV